MPTFSLHDEAALSLTGPGPIADQLRRIYERFPTTTRSPDLRIEVGAVFEPQGPVLGGPKNGYARDEGFLITYGDRRAKLDEDWRTLRTEPEFSAALTITLAEGELRKKLAARDPATAMVHASAVEYEGETILFPAWKGSGKTNTLLTFLEAGANHIADDRLWLDSRGAVRSYPTPLHLHRYNLQSFPDLDPGFSTRRARLSERIAEGTRRSNSRLARTASVLNDALLTQSAWAQVDESFPETTQRHEAEIDRIVLLQATTADEPSRERLSVESFSTAMAAIHEDEWNRDLDGIHRAFDTLFDGEKTDELDALRERERHSISQAARDIPLYRLSVPRRDHWDETLKRALLDVTVQ